MGLLGLGFKLKNTLKAKKVAETITSLRGKSRVAVGNKQPVSGSGAARRQKDVTWV